MQFVKVSGANLVRKVGMVVLAAIVAISLSVSPVMPAMQAQADTGLAAGKLSTQATTFATTKTKTIKSTAKKNAKAIVKSAKATKGTSTAKLKKIYNYIASGKKFKSVSYLNEFYRKAIGTSNAQYYPASQPKNMKNYYKKYAIDAYKMKKAVCYHYAALFAVAAKYALGSKATVKIAVGSTNATTAFDSTQETTWNPHHSWVEVKIGKKTYVYDPMNGYYYSTSVAKKAGDYFKFCGSLKTSDVKQYYKFSEASYCKVTL